MDTIFALSSAPGKAGVAVIRISGPQAFYVCHALAGAVPPARRVSLREKGVDPRKTESLHGALWKTSVLI